MITLGTQYFLINYSYIKYIIIININGLVNICRPKKNWMEVVRKDKKACEVDEVMVSYRGRRGKKRVTDPTCVR